MNRKREHEEETSEKVARCASVTEEAREVYTQKNALGQTRRVEIPRGVVCDTERCEYFPGLCKCTGVAVHSLGPAGVDWKRWSTPGLVWEQMAEPQFRSVKEACSVTPGWVEVPRLEVLNQGILSNALEIYLECVPPGRTLPKDDPAIRSTYFERALAVIRCVALYLRAYSCKGDGCEWMPCSRFLVRNIPILRLVLRDVLDALPKPVDPYTAEEMEEWGRQAFALPAQSRAPWDVTSFPETSKFFSACNKAYFLDDSKGDPSVTTNEWIMWLAEIMCSVCNQGEHRGIPDSPELLCFSVDVCRLLSAMLGGCVVYTKADSKMAVIVEECLSVAREFLLPVFEKCPGYKEDDTAWKMATDHPLYTGCVQVATHLLSALYYASAHWSHQISPRPGEPHRGGSRKTSTAKALGDMEICMQECRSFFAPLLGFGEGEAPRGGAGCSLGTCAAAGLSRDQEVLRVVAMNNVVFDYGKACKWP
jgi:hypothetical protein